MQSTLTMPRVLKEQTWPDFSEIKYLLFRPLPCLFMYSVGVSQGIPPLLMTSLVACGFVYDTSFLSVNQQPGSRPHPPFIHDKSHAPLDQPHSLMDFILSTLPHTFQQQPQCFLITHTTNILLCRLQETTGTFDF